jgi:hypothetical protein
VIAGNYCDYATSCQGRGGIWLDFSYGQMPAASRRLPTKQVQRKLARAKGTVSVTVPFNLKNVLSAVPWKVRVGPWIPVPVLLTITVRVFVPPRLNPVVIVPATRLVKLKACSAPPSVKLILPLPGAPFPVFPMMTPLSSNTVRSSASKFENERDTFVAFAGRLNDSVASQNPSKLDKLPPATNAPDSVWLLVILKMINVR